MFKIRLLFAFLLAIAGYWWISSDSPTNLPASSSSDSPPQSTIRDLRTSDVATSTTPASNRQRIATIEQGMLDADELTVPLEVFTPVQRLVANDGVTEEVQSHGTTSRVPSERRAPSVAEVEFLFDEIGICDFPTYTTADGDGCRHARDLAVRIVAGSAKTDDTWSTGMVHEILYHLPLVAERTEPAERWERHYVACKPYGCLVYLEGSHLSVFGSLLTERMHNDPVTSSLNPNSKWPTGHWEHGGGFLQASILVFPRKP